MAFDFSNMTEEQALVMMYPKQREAFLECMNGQGDVLITASGGKGKSFIIDAVMHFASNRTVATATTGAASVLISGATAHSTLSLPRGIPTKQNMTKTGKRYKNLFKRDHPIQNVIVDEASMLGPQTFDAVLQRMKRISRTSKYRRCRLLLFCDFAQMLNVVKGQEKKLVKELYGTSTLLDSDVFKTHRFKIFELDQNKRTSDKVFQEVLEDIRLGENLDSALPYLNKRVGKPDPDATYICSTNKQVDAINKVAFDANPNFAMYYTAKVSGMFKVADASLEENLPLKEGLRVMSLVNQQCEGSDEPEFVNGSIGIVVSLLEHMVLVAFENGNEVWIEPTKQENTEYFTNDKGDLDSRVIGTFSNIGLRGCAAISVNKSQGVSLSKANIDFGEGGAFTYGQAYTAISRMQCVEGLTLVQQLFHSDIKVNRHVKKFYKELRGDITTDFPIIVAGGRDFNNYPLLCARMDSLLRGKNHADVVIVSGGARGADYLGECYAKERGYRVWRFEAEWDRMGRRAGYIRNSTMADHSDALVAFYDGQSAGTGSMIELAREQGLAVRVIKY